MFPWHRGLARDGGSVRKLFWIICDAEGMTSDEECRLPIAYLTVVPALDFAPVRVFYTEISMAQKIVPQHHYITTNVLNYFRERQEYTQHYTPLNPPSPTQY